MFSQLDNSEKTEFIFNRELLFKLINAISMQILNYREGDIVLLTDIQENLLQLNGNVKQFPSLNRISEILYEIIDLLFKGANWDSIQSNLIAGHDLIQKGLNTISEDFESENIKLMDAIFNDALQNEMDEFIQRFPISTEPQADGFKIPDIAINHERQNHLDKENILERIHSDFYETFSNDCKTRLLRAQDLILELDEDFEKNNDSVNELFRIFHTIKGECGFINLSKIGELTHELETLLDILRKPEAHYDSEFTDVLFSGVDSVRLMTDFLDEEKIDQYLQVDTSSLKSSISCFIEKNQTPLGELLIQDGILSHKEVGRLIKKQSQDQFRQKIGEIAVEEGKIEVEDIEKTLKKQEESLQKNQIKKKKIESVINVKASQVDYLTDMIQELWIAENQIKGDSAQGVKKITHEIQHVVMKLRTVEISQLYIKQRRLIRDLSKKLEKAISVEFSGGALEIDRSLVEAMEEPLMHIVRNAVDHGIETPAERLEKGKDKIGKIAINAERKGNRIIVSIRDDGKGLDHSRIKAKAVKQGLISESEAEKLPLKRIHELITMAGFSTAETLSDVSGRGVGMDVVKSMISSFKGRLQIDSESGKYTNINLIFPLNMAIIEGMIVEAFEQFFVIPISEIIECIHMEEEVVHSVSHKVDVLKIRSEIIPIIQLKELLGDLSKDNQEEDKIAVIVQNGQSKYALLVNRILEKNQLAIKPLGKHFNGLRGISSGTIFQGGKIGLILDIEQIIQEMT